DCFELARDIRVLDMRASPYDLSDLGYAPVRVETPEGKREYAAAQRSYAERGAPLRARLVEECERLLAVHLLRHEG
ncbi:MAG TPA: 3-methyladenine DNA glycosylase, partial [Nocardioidaceae bacterium]|nr:3-methyladenine DNA glycosylase [Nocardioidaceae bacterium]